MRSGLLISRLRLSNNTTNPIISPRVNSSNMPKANSSKRKFGGSSTPYGKPANQYGEAGSAAAAAAMKATNNIFKMNKDLGQHILKNPGIAEKIVEKANLKQSDIVLEVGPGTGNLTAKILKEAKKVIAVEMDPRMAAELTKRVQGRPEQKRLEIILGDVIKSDLPPFDVCISNTPYQISSPLVFKLLALKHVPRTCVLMFQKEFADRLTAQPGTPLYSRLSANVQMWAKVTHLMKVSKGNFRPPPQVESSVVKIEPKVPRPSISYEEWDGLLRIVFIRKNKTMSALFNTSPVLSLIERNYRTYCAHKNIPLGIEDDAADTVMGDDNEAEASDDEAMSDGDEAMIDALGADDLDEMPEQIVDGALGKKAMRENKKKTRSKLHALIKEKVKRVLEKTDLGKDRAIKCDQGDFLRLLYEFNQEGIHFS